MCAPGRTAIAKYRNEISKESPDLWRALTRQEMERLLQDGEKTGKNFYNSILKDNRMFKKFQSALQGNPEAHKRLNLMKKVFANLDNAPSAKASASVMGLPQNAPRGISDFVLEIGRKLTNGMWDEALVDLIISNKWNKELKALEKAPQSEQVQKLGEILDAVEGEPGTFSVPDKKSKSLNTAAPRLGVAMDKIMSQEDDPEELEAYSRIISYE